MSNQTTLHQLEMDKEVSIKALSDHDEEKLENNLFWGTWLVQSLGHITLDPKVVNLSPMLDMELTFLKKERI